MDATEKLKKIEALKKQREEIDRLIAELSDNASEPDALLQTNIPYGAPFLAQCKSAVSAYTYDPHTASPDELLAMRLLINKRCNQISTDYTHTASIISELLPLRSNLLFVEIFARKLLDQGRVLVSSHFDSYRPLSYVLFQLGSGALPSRYLQLLVVRTGSHAELKGMYAIYFGYLNLAEHVAGCWLWLASVLNCEPNALSGYVLETFLTICSGLLREKCGKRFGKLVAYIKKYYIKEIKNAAVETRVMSILDECEKKSG